MITCGRADVKKKIGDSGVGGGRGDEVLHATATRDPRPETREPPSWRLNAPELNDVASSGNTFTLKSPTGSTLTATVIAPAKVIGPCENQIATIARSSVELVGSVGEPDRDRRAKHCRDDSGTQKAARTPRNSGVAAAALQRALECAGAVA